LFQRFAASVGGQRFLGFIFGGIRHGKNARARTEVSLGHTEGLIHFLGRNQAGAEGASGGWQVDVGRVQSKASICDAMTSHPPPVARIRRQAYSIIRQSGVLFQSWDKIVRESSNGRSAGRVCLRFLLPAIGFECSAVPCAACYLGRSIVLACLP